MAKGDGVHSMRNLDHLNEYRIDHPILGKGDSKKGGFLLKLEGSRLEFQVIASDGGDWDHVSVTTGERCPKWNEMQQIKELFFEDHEAVLQLHPPKSDYINVHPRCLHLWRPQRQEIPMPPLWMV